MSLRWWSIVSAVYFFATPLLIALLWRGQYTVQDVPAVIKVASLLIPLFFGFGVAELYKSGRSSDTPCTAFGYVLRGILILLGFVTPLTIAAMVEFIGSIGWF